MDTSNKTEISDLPETDDFLVRSRPKIVNILLQLSKKPTTITAYFNGSQEFILTAVLGVLLERSLVVLDEGPNEKLNERLVAAGPVAFAATHEHIRVKFKCDGLKRAFFKGNRVFACPIPESMLYLERRAYFRVLTPFVSPPVCRVPQEEGGPVPLTVMDLSCAGMGLHDVERRLNLDSLVTFDRCELELPGFGTVLVNLQIRNFNLVKRKDGTEIQRIGAAFSGLRPGTSNRIQRYITKRQLDQRALAKE